MSRRVLVAVCLLLTLTLAVPAAAITNGQPDNGAHPYVGQLLFMDETGNWFNCSGALISSTVLVTAGHCTETVGTNMWVNFAEAPSYDGFPLTADYVGDNGILDPDEKEERNADRIAWLDADPNWLEGDAYLHPDYDPAAFYLADLGVVEMEAAVTTVSTFATLAPVGYFDGLAPNEKKSLRFTPVGYGLENSGPKQAEGGDTRMTANVKIKQINDIYVTFSANNGQPHQGGSCFGDSGGPIFIADTNQIVAVVSFGINTTCAGTGGGYRVDTTDDQAFINGGYVSNPT